MSKLYVDEIHPKTTNGIITVNSSVVSTERPSFFATSTNTGYAALSANDTFAGGDWWNNVDHNVGSHFNASTGIFTAPVNGVYFFSFAVLNDGGATINLEMHKNGTAFIQPFINSERALNFAVNVYLAANDEIEVITLTADSFRLGSNYTWFSGCLIG